MHQLSGTDVVISYLTNLILFTEELAAKLMIYDSSLNTQQPIQGIGTHAHWSGWGLAN